MQIDRILFPVYSLGPGKRMALWTVGCKKRCRRCANPELREFDSSKDISISQLRRMIHTVDTDEIEGFTVSGGEPFCQLDALNNCLDVMLEITDDILIFTGYDIQELHDMHDGRIEGILQKAGVIVAGEYIDELNDNQTALLASSNQQMLCRQEKLLKKYKEYMKQGRVIQNVFYGNAMISVGIHNTREGMHHDACAKMDS